ncbi:hypothetical protein BaOVIS_015670 [Babesia ovis]|uniref:FHA domain-containing protein n=1 Tax=Babesia ovis TaxID=5869 RepID=A0A9W5WUQ8_BABOV|nr:hypothetical protein BaOVIS_015670 [Babesia ovis]
MDNHLEALQADVQMHPRVVRGHISQQTGSKDAVDGTLDHLALLQYSQSDDAGVAVKRRCEHRPSCRRSHHYKLQRVASKSIDSLDLASLGSEGTSALSLQTRNVRHVGCDLVSHPSISKLSQSTTESTAVADMTCDGSDSGLPIAGFDFTIAKHLNGRHTSMSSTLASDGIITLVDRRNLQKQHGSRSNTVISASNYDSVGPSTSRSTSDSSVLFRQSSLGTVRSFPSILSARLHDLYDNVDVAQPGHVESDCEEYCFTNRMHDDDRPSESIGTKPLQASQSDDPLDISNVLDAAKQVELDDSLSYTYSPETQFGVLCLLLHQDSNAASTNGQSSVPPRIMINKSPFIIGTDPTCDLVVEHGNYPMLHGQHCNVIFTKCGTADAELEKLGICAYEVEVLKTNPDAAIFINDSPLDLRGKLRNGHLLALGPKNAALTFSASFRSRESCVSLMNQLNALMLTPSSALKHCTQRDRSPTGSAANCFSPTASASRTSCNGDIECHVNVAIFEQYYGESSVIGSLSQDWDAFSCGASQLGSWSLPQTPSSPFGLSDLPLGDLSHRSARTTPYNSQFTFVHTPCANNVRAVFDSGDMDSQLSDQKSPYHSLRIDMESCNLSNTKVLSPHYEDDAALSGKLLLSAYTTSLDASGDTKVDQQKSGQSDDTRSRLNAAKVARLRSLNRASVPIVVDTSRSLSSDEDSGCLTVSKLRFLGVVPATYQTTLSELLPSIDGLLSGYAEHSPSYRRSVLTDYELLMKRSGDPLSEDDCKYNWVFQLDFFDRDDPLFRRAVYTSHRGIESDKERLRNAVSYTIDQLNRSRVLYIQMRIC